MIPSDSRLLRSCTSDAQRALVGRSGYIINSRTRTSRLPFVPSPAKQMRLRKLRSFAFFHATTPYLPAPFVYKGEARGGKVIVSLAVLFSVSHQFGTFHQITDRQHFCAGSLGTRPRY